jgi:hypothetical protein
MMGFVMLCLTGVIVIGGIIAKVLLERLRWKTKLLLRIKMGH